MDEQQKPFFDKQMGVAIALSFIIWMGWQWHLQKKYPNMHAKTEVAQTSDSKESAPTHIQANEETPVINRKEEIPLADDSQETFVQVDTPEWAFKISSRGMGLRDLTLKKYKDNVGEYIKIGEVDNNRSVLETNVIGYPHALNFAIKKISDTHYMGVAKYGEVEVTKALTLDASRYRIETHVTVNSTGNAVLAGIETFLTERLMPHVAASFLGAPSPYQEIFALNVDGHERLLLNPEAPQDLAMQKVKVVAVGTQYFTQALVDQSDVLPQLKTDVSQKRKGISAIVQHPILNHKADFNVKYTSFIGPKDLYLLKEVDESLGSVVDFGFFSSLGRPILKTLKWFHQLVGNWGVAIILLTLLVRFLVLPFNVMSFRSMKAMQIIQPKIQALREKYKNDANRLNQEMMTLFKENRVNPLGGCLPVLLQIPIFFALYQVLGHSIELYHSPFILWIHDLSQKDPFYVLPVLMGITMFIQQKITPTTMDPMQAKIMLAMPVIFTLFMLALPSGLTLYIFISTLFGIAQQLYLMRSTSPKPVMS